MKLSDQRGETIHLHVQYGMTCDVYVRADTAIAILSAFGEPVAVAQVFGGNGRVGIAVRQACIMAGLSMDDASVFARIANEEMDKALAAKETTNDQ